MTDNRTGGDEDGFGADVLLGAAAQAHGKFVCLREFRMAADQFEFSAFELLCAVFGEFGNEATLSLDDFRAVETEVFRAESEFRHLAHILKAVGRLDECFARHAAPQDAKTAEFLGAIDYRGA